MKSKIAAETTIDDPGLVYYLETRFNFDAAFLAPNELFPGRPPPQRPVSSTASLAPSPSTSSPVAWKYIFDEFCRSHAAENLVKFESDLRSRRSPGLEYGDATGFVYDALLLLSQYYQDDPYLLNALLNLVAELTHPTKVAKYYPYLIAPRNVLLALSFAAGASVDKSLSATFFSLALQTVTSFHPTCFPARMVYQLFIPRREFGAVDADAVITHKPQSRSKSRSKSRGGSRPSSRAVTISTAAPFSHFPMEAKLFAEERRSRGGIEDTRADESDETYDMNSDASFIAHLRRSMWLMAVLSTFEKKKDTSAAQDLWDWIMAEARHMSNKPNFEFGCLYECIPKMYSLVGPTETDCFVNQFKVHSHRPMSLHEIVAVFLEVYRADTNLYRYLMGYAASLRWTPESLVDFSPILEAKNLPYQSANPRIRARADCLFDGGIILPQDDTKPLATAPVPIPVAVPVLPLADSKSLDSVASELSIYVDARPPSEAMERLLLASQGTNESEGEVPFMRRQQDRAALVTQPAVSILPTAEGRGLSRMDSVKSTRTLDTVESDATVTLVKVSPDLNLAKPKNKANNKAAKAADDNNIPARNLYSSSSRQNMVLDIVHDDDDEAISVDIGSSTINSASASMSDLLGTFGKGERGSMMDPVADSMAASTIDFSLSGPGSTVSLSDTGAPTYAALASKDEEDEAEKKRQRKLRHEKRRERESTRDPDAKLAREKKMRERLEAQKEQMYVTGTAEDEAAAVAAAIAVRKATRKAAKATLAAMAAGDSAGAGAEGEVKKRRQRRESEADKERRHRHAGDTEKDHRHRHHHRHHRHSKTDGEDKDSDKVAETRSSVSRGDGMPDMSFLVGPNSVISKSHASPLSSAGRLQSPHTPIIIPPTPVAAVVGVTSGPVVAPGSARLKSSGRDQKSLGSRPTSSARVEGFIDGVVRKVAGGMVSVRAITSRSKSSGKDTAASSAAVSGSVLSSAAVTVSPVVMEQVAAQSAEYVSGTETSCSSSASLVSSSPRSEVQLLPNASGKRLERAGSDASKEEMVLQGEEMEQLAVAMRRIESADGNDEEDEVEEDKDKTMLAEEEDGEEVPKAEPSELIKFMNTTFGGQNPLGSVDEAHLRFKSLLAKHTEVREQRRAAAAAAAAVGKVGLAEHSPFRVMGGGVHRGRSEHVTGTAGKPGGVQKYIRLFTSEDSDAEEVSGSKTNTTVSEAKL